MAVEAKEDFSTQRRRDAKIFIHVSTLRNQRIDLKSQYPISNIQYPISNILFQE